MRESSNIGIVVYDGVEPADYVNPMAILEKTNDYIDNKNTIRLLSRDGSPVHASNRTIVGPAISFREAGAFPVLIVPGGEGVFGAIADPEIVGFIKHSYESPELQHILSVCSGSYLLAEAGILRCKEATVTERLKDDFRKRYPNVTVLDRTPVMADGGRIITSGQIFKGIEATYWLVEKLYGGRVLALIRERLGY